MHSKEKSAMKAWLLKLQDEGSGVVAGSRQQDKFPLLSLPQLVLEGVVQCLDKRDKQILACVCRSLAAVVSAVSPNTQLTVTRATGWKGFSKDPGPQWQRECCCCLWCCCCCCCCCTRAQAFALAFGWFKCNTVDILLKPGRGPRLSIPGVHKLIIDAGPLPSVLPRRLASLLPGLQELEVTLGWDEYGYVVPQPIPYCSSLRKLHCKIPYGMITDMLFGSPLSSKYHTSKDFRKQLPNVVALQICIESCKLAHEQEDILNTLFNAWSGQLTELVLDTGLAPKQLQQCTTLQSLKWRGYSKDTEFTALLPQSLVELELDGHITKSHIQAILQLPQLRVLNMENVRYGVLHDKSKHSSSWQRLTLQWLPIVNLPLMPLQLLSAYRCLDVEVLELPDPLGRNSLVIVQHAAQCLGNAGITIEGLRTWHVDTKPHVTLEDDLDGEADTALAGMIHAAGTVVRPPQSYRFQLDYDMAKYVQATTAIIRWSSTELRDLHMPDITKVQPWIWEVLHHYSHLVKITFPLNHGPKHQYAGNINTVVMQASKSYVAVVQKPLTLMFSMLHLVSDKEREEMRILLNGSLLPPSVLIERCAWESPHVLVVKLKPVRHYSGS